MINIMNFNMLNFKQQINTNLSSNNSNTNQKNNEIGDVLGKEFNINNSNISTSNTKNTNNLDKNVTRDMSKEDIKETLSKFEEVLNKMIEEDKESKLNEDISFIQSIVTLLNSQSTETYNQESSSSMEIKIDALDINTPTHFIQKIDKENILENIVSLDESWTLINDTTFNIDLNNIKSEGTNLDADINIDTDTDINSEVSIDDIATINDNDIDLGLDVNIDEMTYLETNIEPTVEFPTEPTIDAVENSELILEFTKQLDDEFITNFKKLDNLNEKKSMLVNEFEDFITKHSNQNNVSKVNSELDSFYSAFKTNFKLDNNKSKDITIDLDSMKSDDIIELLGNSNNSFSKTLQEISNNTTNTIDFVINKDSMVADIKETITYMSTNNIKQLKIKLTPKELGEMTIDISQINDVSNIKLIISNEDTLNLVKSNLSEIIENLKEKNLITDSSIVTIETETKQNESSFSNTQNFSSNNNQRNNSKQTKENDIHADAPVDASITESKDEGILNILA